MKPSASLPRYLFFELTLKKIRRIIRLKERRVPADSWLKEDQILISEAEKRQLDYVTGRLLPYEPTLMNDATIWGRAIYPMLMMSEKDDLQTYADVSLEAKYPCFILHGIADAVIGKYQAGGVTVPYIVVVERGLEGKPPRFRLYGELLAAARMNWEENPEPEITVFGCYTVADTWTFLQAKITDIGSDIPKMDIESTREYVEKTEAEIIFRILKYMVSHYR